MSKHQFNKKDKQLYKQKIQNNRPSQISIEKSTFLTENQQKSSILQPQSPSKKILPQKVNELINVFRINQVDTRSYKQIIEQIAQSFNTMDILTQKLQDKVDLMLKKQQNQFIESYKLHMKKIKQQFHGFQKRINSYQEKIKYYQNQGKMSHLIKKVNKLEQECKKLYGIIKNNQKVIKDNQLTIKVQKSQIKRYQKQIKALIREKNNAQFQKEKQKNNQQNQVDDYLQEMEIKQDQKNSSNSKTKITNIFSNQILQNSHIQSNHKDFISEQELNTYQSHMKFFNQNSERFSINPQSICENKQKQIKQKSKLLYKMREIQFKRQLNTLKQKNRFLNSFQSTILQSKTQIQSFFIECINQIKQKIRIRKKTNSCSFQDFKKQDKLQLLIQFISNEQILGYLYERIFKKPKVQPQGMKTINSQNTFNNPNKLIQKKNQTLLLEKSFFQKTHNISPGKINISLYSGDKKNTIDLNNINNNTSSIAKRNFFKNIIQNAILPKIHFNLQY